MTRTVVYYTDSLAFGGAEQSLLNLLKGLDRMCWRPVLLHHASDGVRPLVSAAQQLGVETIAVPPMPEGTGLMHLPRFIRQLHALQPAVFHANLTWPLSCKYGLFAATLAR